MTGNGKSKLRQMIEEYGIRDKNNVNKCALSEKIDSKKQEKTE